MFAGLLCLNVNAAETTSFLEITHQNFSEITESYTKTYTHSYSITSDSTGTLGNINVKAYGVFKNSDGIQMNKGKETYIKNVNAFPGVITSMELVWTATGKNSPTIYMSKDSEASKSSTNVGKQSNTQKTQTINFDYSDGYRYFYFDGTTVTGACYLSSFKITYAFKEINRYNVTYKYGNGVEDYVLPNVNEGSLILQAPEQISSFKKVEGWYKDEALTQAWDFENDTVVKNTTLYAKWVDLNVNTLAEACEMPDGNTVVVIAKVTVSKGNSNHFIQDSTGALILYDSSNTYEIGSVYKIYGTLATYSGAKEIKDVVACEKVAQDIVIAPLTSPSDITEANLSKYIELTNYEVPSAKAFEFYSNNSFTKGDIAALTNVGSIINVKGVVSTHNGKMQITVSEVEALPSFVTTDTKSSLIVTYDEELNPTDVDLRLGGVITTDSYLAGATYGVLVTTGTVNLTAGKTKYATVAEFIDANEGFKNVTCTPAKVATGYQFAWVIIDMEGNYNTSLTAVMYMVYDGALYICKSKTTSVKDTASQYITNAVELGLTEEQLAVLGKLVA